MTRSSAQKKAERRYEKKRKGSRFRNWMFITYPGESEPEDWKKIVDDLHVPGFAIVHDKDVGDPETGELKKAHRHILLMFDTVKSSDQVHEIAVALGCNDPHHMDNKRGACRYLCHMDTPDKHPYDVSEVISFCGADYIFATTGAADLEKVLGEIVEFANDNKITSFAQLTMYAKRNNRAWFRALTNKTNFVMQFLKSNTWTIEKEVDRDDEDDQGKENQTFDQGV